MGFERKRKRKRKELRVNYRVAIIVGCTAPLVQSPREMGLFMM